MFDIYQLIYHGFVKNIQKQEILLDARLNYNENPLFFIQVAFINVTIFGVYKYPYTCQVSLQGILPLTRMTHCSKGALTNG
jgi:hypothetical protein